MAYSLTCPSGYVHPGHSLYVLPSGIRFATRGQAIHLGQLTSTCIYKRRTAARLSDVRPLTKSAWCFRISHDLRNDGAERSRCGTAASGIAPGLWIRRRSGDVRPWASRKISRSALVISCYSSSSGILLFIVTIFFFMN
jgi:hypothetical protein